jgi:hypothetical protein
MNLEIKFMQNRIIQIITLALATLFLLDMIYTFALGGRYSYIKQRMILPNSDAQIEFLYQIDKWSGRIWQIDGRYGSREIVPVRPKVGWQEE